LSEKLDSDLYLLGDVMYLSDLKYSFGYGQRLFFICFKMLFLSIYMNVYLVQCWWIGFIVLWHWDSVLNII